MPQNPATLIWVQVTQIFQKKGQQKKGENCIFKKRATKVSTALRCFVFVLFLFTAVARGSAVRSLTSTSDRIKAHSLSL